MSAMTFSYGTLIAVGQSVSAPCMSERATSASHPGIPATTSNDPSWVIPGSKNEPVSSSAAARFETGNVVEPPLPPPPAFAATAITMTAAAPMATSGTGRLYHGLVDFVEVVEVVAVTGDGGACTEAWPVTPLSDTCSVHALPSQYRNWCPPVGSGYQFASVATSAPQVTQIWAGIVSRHDHPNSVPRLSQVTKSPLGADNR